MKQKRFDSFKKSLSFVSGPAFVFTILDYSLQFKIVGAVSVVKKSFRKFRQFLQACYGEYFNINENNIQKLLWTNIIYKRPAISSVLSSLRGMIEKRASPNLHNQQLVAQFFLYTFLACDGCCLDFPPL